MEVIIPQSELFFKYLIFLSETRYFYMNMTGVSPADPFTDQKHKNVFEG